MLQLGPVYLNVLDLPRLSQFYQEVVGLSVLSKTKAQIVLGIQVDQRPLVILQLAAKEDKQTAELLAIASRAPKLEFQIKHQTTRQLQLLDTDGIAIQIDYQH